MLEQITIIISAWRGPPLPATRGQPILQRIGPSKLKIELALNSTPLYIYICLYHNVYSARAKPCQGTQAHRAHRSRRHTGTEAHAHRHSAHTSMLHVCCPLVRDEVNWFLQHVHRQYNKMEIDILCGRARLWQPFPMIHQRGGEERRSDHWRSARYVSGQPTVHVCGR